MLKKLPNIALIAFGLISVILSLMFLLGLGDPDAAFTSPNSGESLTNSTYTDLFMWWAYILFGITLIVTIFFSVLRFCKLFASDPKRGIKVLVVLVAFVAIFVITWLLGSEEELVIPGYAGDENVGLWARFSDMMIFTSYVLVAGTILALVFSIIYSKVKK